MPIGEYCPEQYIILHECNMIHCKACNNPIIFMYLEFNILYYIYFNTYIVYALVCFSCQSLYMKQVLVDQNEILSPYFYHTA